MKQKLRKIEIGTQKLLYTVKSLHTKGDNICWNTKLTIYHSGSKKNPICIEFRTKAAYPSGNPIIQGVKLRKGKKERIENINHPKLIRDILVFLPEKTESKKSSIDGLELLSEMGYDIQQLVS